MPEEGMQPQPEPATTKPLAAGAMVMTSYTISANFGSSGTTTSVSLDLSSVNDMGGDDVTIYSATGTTPTSRQNGSTNRHGQWTAAPARLPSSEAGGSSTNGSNYWVQLINTTRSKWYQGNVTAGPGTLNIVLSQQTW